MKRDTWLGVNILLKFSSLAHTVWERQYFEDISTKDDLVTELINHTAICRKAPATPGLSITPHLTYNVEFIIRYPPILDHQAVGQL